MSQGVCCIKTALILVVALLPLGTACGRVDNDAKPDLVGPPPLTGDEPTSAIGEAMGHHLAQTFPAPERVAQATPLSRPSRRAHLVSPMENAPPPERIAAAPLPRREPARPPGKGATEAEKPAMHAQEAMPDRTKRAPDAQPTEPQASSAPPKREPHTSTVILPLEPPAGTEAGRAASAPPVPSNMPRFCPPPDADGVVRCPILAGWSEPIDTGSKGGVSEGQGALLILAAMVLAAFLGDLLRRLIR